MEGGKPENPEKNPRSTGETNYNNSTHMSSDPSSGNTDPGLYQGGHPSSYNPNRPGLTSEISDELTAYTIRAPQNEKKKIVIGMFIGKVTKIQTITRPGTLVLLFLKAVYI